MIQLRKALLGAGVLLAAGMAASAASAAPGYATSRTSLLAGPGGQYPVVARIGGGDRVEIFGCVRGWSYCDVSWRGLRGWARGASLQLFYRDRRVSLYQYGPTIGLPFVSFSIGSYWGSHYHNQPWYFQAYRWGGPRFDRDGDHRRSDNNRRDNDNDRPRMERGPGPNMGFQGNGGFQRNNPVTVERRNRNFDLQGNSDIRTRPNFPPQARDNNRRGGNDGGGGCGPGQERVGTSCLSNPNN